MTPKPTEKDLAERVLELQRSNRQLKQFAHVAAHELQEPLRKISSFCQLLQQEHGDRMDEPARDYLARSVDAAGRMSRLIKDLLTDAQLHGHDPPLGPTDAGQACAQAVEQLQSAIDDSSAVVAVGSLPTILADPPQLVLLFQNLIGNAAKYRGTHAPIVHVDARPDGPQWRFAVRDNGLGIRAEDHERIFAMFQRLHPRGQYPGTGIGLALCRRIVERMGGRIWVESQLGKGSVFYFTALGP